MKRLTLSLTFALLCATAPIVAQRSAVICVPACGPKPVFAIYGWIDSPSTYMVQPYAPGFHISGWTFDCRSGQQPPFVAVLDHDYTTGVSRWVTSYTVERGLARPDVQTAYRDGCLNLSSAVGYTIYPGTLTTGQHALTVFWTTGDGLSRSMGVTVDVP